jgi:uncharacterized protein (DUF1697 family)
MTAPGAAFRYAVFLRGVNVGGVTMRMADLRDELAGLPVAEVATVLASGNVTCSSSLAPADLKERVEGALRRRFGYEAWVIVVERADLVGIAAAVPAPAGPPGGVHTYVTFFTGRAERDGFLAEAAALAEQPTVLTGGTAISWFSPKGQSTEVPVAKLLARARYASTSTTRNINTVDKVLRLLA